MYVMTSCAAGPFSVLITTKRTLVMLSLLFPFPKVHIPHAVPAFPKPALPNMRDPGDFQWIALSDKFGKYFMEYLLSETTKYSLGRNVQVLET